MSTNQCQADVANPKGKHLTGLVKNGLARLSLPIALFLLVAGLRLTALDYAGSPLPFYDQWLAEFNNTLLLLSGGHYGIGPALWLPHNEHRLVGTKLLVLASYTMAGSYDVLLLGTISALIYAGLAASLFVLLSEKAGIRARLLLWALCALFFAIPYSGYNVLCSMQVSFTFVQLALLLGLRAVIRWPGNGRGALGMLAGSLLGLANLGAGVMVPVALLVAGLAGPARRQRAFWLASAASILFACWFVLHAGITDQARDVLRSLRFGAVLLSWPFQSPGIGLAVCLALLWLIVHCAREDVFARPPARVALGVLAFAVGNTLLLAANRTPDEFHPRHWEITSLVPLAGLALLIQAIDHGADSRRKTIRLAAMLALLGIYGAGLGGVFRSVTMPYYESQHSLRDEAAARYRREILADGALDMTYDFADAYRRMEMRFFDDPVWSHTIPTLVCENIRRHPRLAIGLLTPSLFPAETASNTAQRQTATLRGGGLWIALAGGLLALGAAAKFACDRRARSVS
jgi:hypothetical protein